MSQEDILKLLKKHRNKWFTTREIADELNLTTSGVTLQMNKLFKFNEIKRRIEKIGDRERYYFKYRG